MRKLTVALVLCFTVLPWTQCPAATKITYGDANAVLRQVAADKGHVVLLNFWATWCPPCVAEYPSLVKLDRRYRKRGLDIIAVSLDFHDDIVRRVKPFVAKQNAAFTQYVLNVDDPEKAIDAFDPSWQGDLPRTFVYSRSGRLITVLPNQQTYAKFAHAVRLGFVGS